MQMFCLHKNIYKLASYALRQENLSETAERLRKALGNWDLLRLERVRDDKIARITGISRSTYYRRKRAIRLYGLKGFENRSRIPHKKRQSKVPESFIHMIYTIRKENPTYGKAKIAVILRRDHNIMISESTVGRVITKLIEQHKVERSCSCAKSKRRRVFKHHAQRWQYGMKAMAPGEMVQIDHMTVTKNNISFKHFQAWDPITKTIVAQVTSSAKSCTAAGFLKKVVADLPFKLKSVQVDGGSEFMRDFEVECEKFNLSLYVLPPKRPQYNGGVERGNRIFREEFYNRKDLLADSVRHFNALLQKAVLKYNSYRPHFNLNGLTPYEYNSRLSLAA